MNSNYAAPIQACSVTRWSEKPLTKELHLHLLCALVHYCLLHMCWVCCVGPVNVSRENFVTPLGTGLASAGVVQSRSTPGGAPRGILPQNGSLHAGGVCMLLQAFRKSSIYPIVWPLGRRKEGLFGAMCDCISDKLLVCSPLSPCPLISSYKLSYWLELCSAKPISLPVFLGRGWLERFSTSLSMYGRCIVIFFCWKFNKARE